MKTVLVLGTFLCTAVSAAGVSPTTMPLRAPASLASGTAAGQDPSVVEASSSLDRFTRRLIQQGLRNEGFDPGTPDGLFGPRTRAAIRGWQAARVVSETGYLDETQAGVLRAAGAPRPAAPEVGVAASPAVAELPTEPASQTVNCDGWNTQEFFAKVTAEEVATCVATGADINAQDRNDGLTPLHYATRSNDLDPAVIDALLAAGADVNARGTLDQTPLHDAAEFNDNPAVVATLLAAGADVNARNRHDQTPLIVAEFNENPAVVATLLAASADLSAQNSTLLIAAGYNAKEPTYHFKHVPFEGDHWLYLRREVSAYKHGSSEERMVRGGSLRHYRARRLMGVRNTGPVNERYIDVMSDDWETKDGEYGTFRPDDSREMGKGRYQLDGPPEGRTILRDGAPYGHPTEAMIRDQLATPWDWQVIAQRLDGATWRVGETRALSPADRKQMGFADDVAAIHLELRSVGERWGRRVAEFAIDIEEDGEPVLSSERVLSRNEVMYIDVETLRPILQTFTLRVKEESRTADGEPHFWASHRRLERVYRFPDVPLYRAKLKLLSSGFETAGNDNRTPIDIGVTGRGDALYIHERASRAGTTSHQDRVGAWDILSRKPIAVLSLAIGDGSRLVTSRSSDSLQLQTPYYVNTYLHHGTDIKEGPRSPIGGGPDGPKVTASVSIGNYTVIGDDSGRVRLGRIGGLEYDRIEVSEAPIVAIAAGVAQGDRGQFATLDGAGDVRHHEVTVTDTSRCRIGTELFDGHCATPSIDMDALRPLANVAETGCISATGGTLVISPGAEMIGWTDFEDRGGGVRPHGFVLAS